MTKQRNKWKILYFNLHGYWFVLFAVRCVLYCVLWCYAILYYIIFVCHDETKQLICYLIRWLRRWLRNACFVYEERMIKYTSLIVIFYLTYNCHFIFYWDCATSDNDDDIDNDNDSIHQIFDRPTTLSSCAHSFCMNCIDEYASNAYECPGKKNQSIRKKKELNLRSL